MTKTSEESLAVFQRTIIKLGNGLAIKLPPAWTRAHGIEPGLKLQISVASDGNLVIGKAEV